MAVHHTRSSLGRRRGTAPGPPTTGDKLLLACGPLSGLVYVLWHEAAALRWEGYSRIGDAISELHLTGAPSKPVLDPWEGIVYNVLVIAFGIGVWRSAGDRWVLRVVGAQQVVAGSTAPLWALFGEASLAAHLALAVVGILAWAGSMGFGAAAFGRGFRLFSWVCLATVIVFNALALSYAPDVAVGEPTPFTGLDERIAFSAYFLWQAVLAGLLWHERRAEPRVRSAPRRSSG
ncbi:DUF998 domain-containing protein [Kocuria turfanensis]|uniref:DUF998 domain-containing protein n=1 Tax=Kocuria turfanensis TaxID=388357 RepID=UPI00403678BA